MWPVRQEEESGVIETKLGVYESRETVLAGTWCVASGQEKVRQQKGK